jgi:multisubunit Na+/H+ antiporter MnhG subunit
MEATNKEVANGAAMAAFLAVGIGSFALGFIVILNAVGLFAVPALYGPAGGVTGRTTLAVVIWLIAWVVLHSRWKDQQIEPRRIHVLSLTLIGLGILLTTPPVWRLF